MLNFLAKLSVAKRFLVKTCILLTFLTHAAWKSTYLYEHVQGEQCNPKVINNKVSPERERRSVLHELVAQPYAE